MQDLTVILRRWHLRSVWGNPLVMPVVLDSIPSSSISCDPSFVIHSPVAIIPCWFSSPSWTIWLVSSCFSRGSFEVSVLDSSTTSVAVSLLDLSLMSSCVEASFVAVVLQCNRKIWNVQLNGLSCGWYQILDVHTWITERCRNIILVHLSTLLSNHQCGHICSLWKSVIVSIEIHISHLHRGSFVVSVLDCSTTSVGVSLFNLSWMSSCVEASFVGVALFEIASVSSEIVFDLGRDPKIWGKLLSFWCVERWKTSIK